MTGLEMDIIPLRSDGRRAALTLDLEYDYGGDATSSLDRFEHLVRWTSDRGLELTVFTEGRVLQYHDSIVDLLKEPHIYPALHCYDHRQPRDTRDDIRRGRDIFAERFGGWPSGYRAHTFQHSEELIEWLLDMGFGWDSSFLPTRIGFGAGRDPGLWRVLRGGGDAALYRERGSGRALVELPVGAVSRIRTPFVHSYQLLIGPRISAMVQRLFGLPVLFIHDMHMVDIYKSLNSISASGLPASAAVLYRLSWLGRRRDSLDILEGFIERCTANGWRWTNLPWLADKLKQSNV